MGSIYKVIKMVSNLMATQIFLQNYKLKVVHKYQF